MVDDAFHVFSLVMTDKIQWQTRRWLKQCQVVTFFKEQEIYDGLAIKELNVARLACSHKSFHWRQKIT